MQLRGRALRRDGSRGLEFVLDERVCDGCPTALVRVEGRPMRIHTPLIHLTKADIIRRGQTLGVDYARTVSCYQADDQGRACGRCDSCRLRAEGFRAAGLPDPTRYA